MAAVAGDYQDGRLTERLQQNVLVDNQLLSLLEVGLPTSVRTAVTRSARAIDRRGPTAVGPTPNAQPAPRRFSVYPGAAAPTGASRVPNSRCTVPELTRESAERPLAAAAAMRTSSVVLSRSPILRRTGPEHCFTRSPNQ